MKKIPILMLVLLLCAINGWAQTTWYTGTSSTATINGSSSTGWTTTQGGTATGSQTLATGDNLVIEGTCIVSVYAALTVKDLTINSGATLNTTSASITINASGTLSTTGSGGCNYIANGGNKILLLGGSTVNNFIQAVSGVTSGSGYSGTPTVSISGGGGSGATATCTQSSGAINAVTITAAGTGYSAANPPTVTFSSATTTAVGRALVNSLGGIAAIVFIEGGINANSVTTSTPSIFSGANILRGAISAATGTSNPIISLSANSNTTLAGGTSGFGTTKTIRGNSTASLTMGGTSGAAATLYFDQTTAGTTNILKTLTSNMTFALGATSNVTTLQINDTLFLQSGTLTVASGSSLTVNSGKTIRRSAGSVTATGTFTVPSNVNVFYSGAVTPSNEFPATVGSLNIAANITLTGTKAVTGALTLTSGTFTNSSGTSLTVGSINRIAGTISAVPTFSPTPASITYSGTGNITTSIELPASGANLTINKTSGVVTLGANTSVGSLTLTSGVLALSTLNLTVTSTSGASASSYVDASGSGNFIYNSVGGTATVLPIGTSSAYTPITLTNTSGTPNVTVGVAALSLAVANSANVVNLQWDIQSSGASTADVTYQFNGANYTSFNPAGSVELGAYTTSFTTSSVSVVSNSVTVTGATLPTTNNTYVIGNAGSIVAAGNAISNVSYTGATTCAGNTISVTFDATGTYDPVNIFSVQLSNASGNFTGATTIGSITSVTAATITATIPAGATGSGYRIRVVSSSPGVTSSDNGSNIAISGTAGLWIGSANGNFNSASNWCDGIVPSSSSDVTVSNGNMPQLSANISVRNLTLTNTLLNLNGFRLTIAGTTSYTGSGAIRGSSSSSITSSSTSPLGLTLDQSTDGTTNTLSNLTVSGSTGLLTVNNNLSVAGLTVGDSISLASGTTLKFIGIASGFTRTGGALVTSSNGAATLEFAATGGFSDTVRMAAGFIPQNATAANLVNIVINGCSVGLANATTNSYYANNLTFSNNGLFTTGTAGNGGKLYVAGTLTGTGRFQFAGSTGNQRIYLLNGAIVNNLNLTGLSGGQSIYSIGSFDVSGNNGNITFTGTNVLNNVGYAMNGASNTNTQQVIFSGSTTSLAGINGSSSTKTVTTDASTTLTLTGTSASFFATSGSSTVGTLSVNASTTLSNALTVANALNITAGTLAAGTNLTLNTGLTITRKAGSFTGTPTFGSTVNIVYADTSVAVTSGSELPTTPSVLNNLTVNSAGGVTLSAPVTVNGTLSLQNGVFTNGSNLTVVGTIDEIEGSITSAPLNTAYNLKYSSTIAAQTTSVELPATLTGTLTINNASGVSLGSSATVSAVAFTTGNLTLGNFNLTAASTSGGGSSKFINTNGDGSFKISSVSTSAVTFPIGNGSNYAPLTITLNSGSTGITVSTASRSIGVNTPANVVGMQWDIQADAASAATVVYTYPAGLANSGTKAVLGYSDGAGWTNTSLSGQTATSGTVSSFTIPTTNNTYVLAVSSADLAGSGTITVGSITPLSLCAGSTISIPYTVTGSYPGGNVFTARLSNTAGSSFPTTIGSLTSDGAGTITATIPSNATAATTYKIQVSSTSGVAGVSTGSTITILAAGTWVGANNASSLTASNWCGGVPTSSTAVVISNTTPRLMADLSVASIALNSGLDFNGFNVTVNGSISGSGTIKGHANSALSLKGGSLTFDQVSANGNRLASITTASGATAVTLNNALTTNAINVVAGGFTLGTNAALKLTGTTLTRTAGTISGATANNGSSFEIANTRDSVTIDPALVNTNTNLIFGNSGVITGTSTPSFIKIGGASGGVTAAGHASVNNLTFRSGSNFFVGFVNGASVVSRSITVYGTLSGSGSYKIYSAFNDATQSANSRILMASGSTINNFVSTGNRGVAVVGSTITLSGTTELTGGSAVSGGLIFNSSIGAGGTGSPTANAAVTLAPNSNITLSYISGSLTTSKYFVSDATSSLRLSSYSGNLYLNASGNAAQIKDLYVSGTDTLRNALTVNGLFTIGGASSFTTASNLTLGNSGSAVLDSSSILKVGSGTIFDVNGRSFTIKSSSTGTGIIAPIDGTISNATNTTVERYIPKGKRAFRDIAPGVAPSTSVFNSWQEGGAFTAGYGTYITGLAATKTFTEAKSAIGFVDGTSGLDLTASGSKSMFTFNNTTGNWDNGVVNTKNLTLDGYSGYRVLVRGDRNWSMYLIPQAANMINATTLRSTGTLLTGNQTGFTLNADATGTGSNSKGFSLVGNPYVAPIDWNTIVLAGRAANLSTSIYFLNPKTIGYVTYSQSTGLTSPNTNNYGRYIQPGQGFFVRTTAASPSLEVRESDKMTTQSFIRDVFDAEPTSAQQVLRVGLYKPVEGITTSMVDETVAVFGNFSNAVNGDDSYKMENSADNIALLNSGNKLAIEARSAVSANDVLPVSLNKLSNGTNYQLKVDASGYNSNGFDVYVKDAYKQTETSVKAGGESVVDFTIDNAVSASYNDRFTVVFKPSVLPISSIDVQGVQQGSDVVLSINTVGESNIGTYSVEKSTDGVGYSVIATVAAKNTATASYGVTDNKAVSGNNYYRVKVNGLNEASTYSKVVVVKVGSGAAKYALYPNPSNGSQVGVQLTGVSAGKYTVTLRNMLGQEVHRAVVAHVGGNGQLSIKLASKLSSGSYTVSVLGATSTPLYQGKLVVE